jgi:transcriptional regulator with XRE-family HTH domain
VTGKQIKAIRKSLGMTQTEFAKAMMVSFATENRWEKDHHKPLPDRLARLKQMRSKR